MAPDARQIGGSLTARRLRRGTLVSIGFRCSSRTRSEGKTPWYWPTQSRRVPCEFPSFVSLFLSHPVAHGALHFTHYQCQTASTGSRSGQVRCLLFHLHVLGKPGSSGTSACQAPAGRRRLWRSSCESSRRRRHVCHR